MNKLFGILGVAGLIWICSTGIGMACTNPDYGDAKGYVSGRAWDGNLQRLGEKWDSEKQTANWVNRDGSDDGVTWRWRSQDNSGTWGSWDGWGNDDLYLGDQVQFRFAINDLGKKWDPLNGINGGSSKDQAYSYVKAWVDWDQKNGWNNAANALNKEVVFKEKVARQLDPDNGNKYIAGTTYRYTDENGYDITENMAGTLVLRARVGVDSRSYNLNTAFTPQSCWYRGEVEDWYITVNDGTRPQDPAAGTSPVPEPATMVLFGVGLIGLAGMGRRRKNTL